jgi:crotonobetainyl-CoA:carnitine CoA-transferase CaiB-like acyl-CoA transferase
LVGVHLRDGVRVVAETGKDVVRRAVPAHVDGQGPVARRDVVPRGGNAGGGGQPGWVLKCKGWESDPNAYIYFTIQEQNWAQTCRVIGKPEWIDDPAYNTAEARQPHIFDIFDEIEKWLADKTRSRTSHREPWTAWAFRGSTSRSSTPA